MIAPLFPFNPSMTIHTEELDNLGRQGPKHGIHISKEEAQRIFTRHLNATVLEYKVSPKGYNNRLYWVTTDKGKFVLKAGGRYWKRAKTETEIAAIVLVSKHTAVPVPRIRGWCSDTSICRVEYVITDEVRGSALSDVWPSMSMDEKKHVLQQLAEYLGEIKAKVTADLLSQQRIGNFLITNTGSGDTSTNIDIVIDKTIDGVDGGCTAGHYFAAMLDMQLDAFQQDKVYDGMRHLLPRIQTFTSQSAKLHAMDSAPVFIHGDISLANILVDKTGPIYHITAILDWEWAGFFPVQEEFGPIADMLDSDPPDLLQHLYRCLEMARYPTGTPNTIPTYGRLSKANLIRDAIAPWWLRHRPESKAEETKMLVEKCAKELDSLLLESEQWH
ncbi:kinase-like domain-containing protein [Lipomyces starkeyi]